MLMSNISFSPRDIASNEADTLLNMLQKREQEIVRFNDFASGVTSCFLFKGG
jgi:hypothetical protein